MHFITLEHFLIHYTAMQQTKGTASYMVNRVLNKQLEEKISLYGSSALVAQTRGADGCVQEENI